MPLAFIRWSRVQIRELETRLEVQGLHRRIAEERLARRVSTLTVKQVAGELLDVLRCDDQRRDSAERRVLLRDLVVEIEDRHVTLAGMMTCVACERSARW